MQAADSKNNFYVEDGLFHHKETLWGHKIVQLCLPNTRIPVVLEMGHDAPFAGHMAFKSTKYRIKFNFWFPEMDEKINEHCKTCPICQLRAPLKVAQRVPITSITRDDELPFSHLIVDCIGPLLPDRDPVKSKPEYNYALLVVDKFSRWPMAYPLKSLRAKTVCDALLQLFMNFSLPKVISSDCGTNFTNQMTQEFLKSLGCRFNTPGHPEAAGCNRSLKQIIYKLVQDNPKGWHQLLQFILWSLRERPSSTMRISQQYTIQEMMDNKIITPSKSEMASPVVCVLKKSGGPTSVRLAIDYRNVNKHSMGDCFPAPDVQDVLQKVGRARWISCFNAKNGYWQIPMKKESQWLTAFVCDEGLFEFKRMPFCLKSASNTFIIGMYFYFRRRRVNVACFVFSSLLVILRLTLGPLSDYY